MAHGNGDKNQCHKQQYAYQDWSHIYRMSI